VTGFFGGEEGGVVLETDCGVVRVASLERRKGSLSSW
jgi:hypothetical protein